MLWMWMSELCVGEYGLFPQRSSTAARGSTSPEGRGARADGGSSRTFARCDKCGESKVWGGVKFDGGIDLRSVPFESFEAYGIRWNNICIIVWPSACMNHPARPDCNTYKQHLLQHTLPLTGARGMCGAEGSCQEAGPGRREGSPETSSRGGVDGGDVYGGDAMVCIRNRQTKWLPQFMCERSSPHPVPHLV